VLWQKVVLFNAIKRHEYSWTSVHGPCVCQDTGRVAAPLLVLLMIRQRDAEDTVERVETGDWKSCLTNHGHLRGPWSNHNSQSSPRYLKAMICSSVGRSLSRYVYGIVVWPLNVHCKFFCRRRRTARRCCYLMNSLPGKRAERRMVRLNYARRRYTVTAARV